jgi:hypothetical protein
LHTHSEHWQHFQSVLLSLAVGQRGHLPWVQNGPVGYEKKKTPNVKKQYVCRTMILCQWDLDEQIQKLVRLLLYTREIFLRKFHAWVHFVPNQ